MSKDSKRFNVYAEDITGPRMRALEGLIGLEQAMGAFVHAGWLAGDHWPKAIPKDDFGLMRFHKELLAAKFFVEKLEGYELFDAATRFEYIETATTSGRKGGLKSVEGRKRDEKGRLMPKDDEPSEAKAPLAAGASDSQAIQASCSSSFSGSSSSSDSKNPITANAVISPELERAKRAQPRGPVSDFADDPDLAKFLSDVRHSTQHAWIKAYGDLGWLRQEFIKAIAWIEINPRRRPKNIARFMGNWLSSGWERYRKTIPASSVMPHMATPNILAIIGREKESA